MVTTSDNVYEERIKHLEAEKASLMEKNTQLEKMKISYAVSVEIMKTSIESLQEVLVTCRADMLLQQSQTSVESHLPESPVPDDVIGSPGYQAKLYRSNSTFANLKTEIDTLKAQLEIYKNDFAEERMARLAVQVEKAQLEAELQQLQQQNRQLIVEALNGHAADPVSSQVGTNNNHRSSASPGSVDHQAGAESRRVRMDSRSGETSHCMHCNADFGDIHSLETHIEECPAY
ncbi:NF-kappa-B essential modulator-like [Uranotaenia lowii]|uniref:NF-kappa-B essential modulator-like n=1 Tax=Uranotaenia lowii TaxID=190385 RepID=UPI002478EB01|nr:NF-kappa-B essential modulator-like [Uranotaenia lowii]